MQFAGYDMGQIKYGQLKGFGEDVRAEDGNWWHDAGMAGWMYDPACRILPDSANGPRGGWGDELPGAKAGAGTARSGAQKTGRDAGDAF